jgi:antitoxin YefM
VFRMQAVLYSDLRQNLKHYLDIAFDNHEPVIVTRSDNRNVVILSLEDYNSISETSYLLSSENNTKHVLSSLEKARNGKTFKKELIEK